MKKTIWIIAASLLSLSALAQDDYYSHLYRGKMDGFGEKSRSITLYLRSHVSECTGDTIYSGMYRYDGISNWLELQIHTDEESHFIMVEYPFTGVLMLRSLEHELRGRWLSPDGSRTHDMYLFIQKMDAERREVFEDTYEELIWSNHDC